jgi:hypothetical protein
MSTSTNDQIDQIEAKLLGLEAAVAARRAVAEAFWKSDVREAEEQMLQFQRVHGWPRTAAPEPALKRQLEDALQDVGNRYSELCELIRDAEYPLKRAREELEELQTKTYQEQYAERERPAAGRHG